MGGTHNNQNMNPRPRFVPNGEFCAVFIYRIYSLSITAYLVVGHITISYNWILTKKKKKRIHFTQHQNYYNTALLSDDTRV